MHRRFVPVGGTVLAVASVAAAAILEVSHVPGAPYATVQSAINAAIPNQDEVYVRCGRYPENIVMRSGVPLRGEKPQCTILDGQFLGPVVTMTDVVNTKLSGFTIERGTGGISVLRGSPIIDGNLIRDNDGGVGIDVDFASPAAPVITRNVISGNVAYGGDASAITVSGSGRVEANVIAGNGAGYAAVSAYQFSGTIVNN